MAGGDVIRPLAEWLLVAFIGLALVLEVALHKLEHWIVEKHPHVQLILRNLYRELMILGLVSFGFIMFLFTNNPTKDFKMTFEVAHIFVFLFAIFHSFVVALAVFLSLNLSKRWKSFERMDLVHYLERKEKYRKLTDKRTKKKSVMWRYLAWWMPAPQRLFRYAKLHEIMAFHDIRWQFIYYRNLQPDFRFSKFLRKIKMATFIELVEIHPLNWILLIAIILLDIFRHGVGSHRDFEAKFFIAHSIFNVIAVTILASKIHRVYWKMTKNPALYYDTVNPYAFREELAVVEEEARIRRESITSRSGDGRRRHPRRSLERNSGRLSLDSAIFPSVDGPRHSLERPARPSIDSSSRHSVDGHSAKHNPIYHNMALKPGEHAHGHGHGPDHSQEQRYSLDLSKRRIDRERPTPSNATLKPARYDPSGRKSSAPASVDLGSDDTNNLIEHARRRFEDQTAGRLSLDMQAVMPNDELDSRADRASIESYWQTNQPHIQSMSEERRKLRIEAMKRLRARRLRNNALVETAQDVQAAQSSSPKQKHPQWLVKVFPRLGRVASAAEKLFWFGSHKFYLFCVENLLFFSNVNIAASIARLIFWFKEMSEYQKQKAAVLGIAPKTVQTVRIVLEELVRAPAKTKKKQTPPDESLLLVVIAFVVACFASAYVLFRVAGIMRKYIFVLNNANLLPEDMTVTTIQTVNLKDMMNAETMHDADVEKLIVYDSESECEGSQAGENREAREKMSSFLENEQKNADEAANSADNAASAELYT